jgi:hypothetical protein
VIHERVRSRANLAVLGLSLAVGLVVVAPIPGEAATRGWTRVSTPALQRSRMPLLDVACPTVSFCAAAGVVGNGSHQVVATMKHGEWSLKDLGTNTGQLLSVSCATPTFCVAVGSSIRMWDGSSWRNEAIRASGFPGFGNLTSVACVSTTFCMAAGVIYRGPLGHALINQWDGHRWRFVPAPGLGPNNSTSITGIACPTTTSCFAVGNTSTNESAKPFAAHWDGARWSLNRTVLTGRQPEPFLSDVSCPSPIACMAIGSRFTSGVVVPYATRFDGTRWTPVELIADIGDTERDFLSISCPRTTFCVAVGIAFSSVGGYPVMETWNGARWSVERLPSSGNAAQALFGTSCATASACVAVGTSIDANATEPHALVLKGP